MEPAKVVPARCLFSGNRLNRKQQVQLRCVAVRRLLPRRRPHTSFAIEFPNFVENSKSNGTYELYRSALLCWFTPTSMTASMPVTCLCDIATLLLPSHDFDRGRNRAGSEAGQHSVGEVCTSRLCTHRQNLTLLVELRTVR